MQKQSPSQPTEPRLLDAKGLYNRAIRLLSRQEYCAAQLRQKLQKVAEDGSLITPLITQLQQQGYLSDHRFAEAYLRSRIQRGETLKIAAMRAEQKGVDNEALREAVDAMDIDEGEACHRLLQKRDPQGLRFGDRRLWQRHLRYLCNKGYPMEIVLTAMQQRDPKQEGAYTG